MGSEQISEEGLRARENIPPEYQPDLESEGLGKRFVIASSGNKSSAAPPPIKRPPVAANETQLRPVRGNAQSGASNPEVKAGAPRPVSGAIGPDEPNDKPSRQPTKMGPASPLKSAAHPSPARNAGSDDEEIGFVHRDARDADQRTFQQTVDQMDAGVLGRDGTSVNGRIASGQLVNIAVEESLKAQKKKDDEARKLAMAILKAEIARLEADIERWKSEIDGLEKEKGQLETDNGRDKAKLAEEEQKLQALEQIRLLQQSGQWDPANPEHQDLAQQAGFDSAEDATPEAVEEALDETKVTIDQLKDDIASRTDRINDINNQIDALNEKIAAAEERIRQIKKDPNYRQADIDDADAERDASEDAKYALDDQLSKAVDEEIGEFMKACAKIDQDYDGEQAEAMKRTLAEKLSQQAQDELKGQNETKYLFEDDGKATPMQSSQNSAPANPTQATTPTPG